MEQYLSGSRLALLNLAIGLGTFIQILDTSIANVAIPYIAGNLSVSADEGTWVITSFAASNAIVLPLTGWLSNYFGRVRLFVWSVVLFSAVSFLCGLSTSLTMLVTLRVIQGAVAGSLIPLSQSLIVANNPPDKTGGAMGFWAMIVIVAPVLGPIIGGYLTDVYSWPWIFYINVPIGLFSAAVTWYFLHDQDSQIVRNPIDWLGLVLLATAVGCLQIMLDKGKDLDWFNSNIIIALTVVSFVSFSYFCIWNYFQAYPIVDFSVFRNRNFVIGTLAITLGFLAYFSSTVTTPLWLQTEQNYTPYWAGIAVAPIGIIPFFLSSKVGKFMYNFDLRYIITFSFLTFSVGYFLQASFTTEVDLGMIMFVRLAQGIGVAFFFLPLVALSLGDIPKDKYTSASGIFNFIRILIGSGFGTSLSIYLWWYRQTIHHARLGEAISSYQPITNQFYETLENVNPAYTHGVVSRIIDMGVQQQAYMLATNEMCWLGGWLFLALIPMLYLCRPVKPPNAHDKQTPQAAH